MNTNKTRRILAVIALVFMAIFSVTLVMTFVSPGMWNGAVGYMALISGLLGIGLFLVIRFVLKDETAKTEDSKAEEEKPEEEKSDRDGAEGKEDQKDD